METLFEESKACEHKWLNVQIVHRSCSKCLQQEWLTVESILELKTRIEFLEAEIRSIYAQLGVE